MPGVQRGTRRTPVPTPPPTPAPTPSPRRSRHRLRRPSRPRRRPCADRRPDARSRPTAPRRPPTPTPTRLPSPSTPPPPRRRRASAAPSRHARGEPVPTASARADPRPSPTVGTRPSGDTRDGSGDRAQRVGADRHSARVRPARAAGGAGGGPAGRACTIAVPGADGSGPAAGSIVLQWPVRVSFGGVEWLVPGLVLTVPGLLIVARRPAAGRRWRSPGCRSPAAGSGGADVVVRRVPSRGGTRRLGTVRADCAAWTSRSRRPPGSATAVAMPVPIANDRAASSSCAVARATTPLPALPGAARAGLPGLRAARDGPARGRIAVRLTGHRRPAHTPGHIAKSGL